MAKRDYVIYIDPDCDLSPEILKRFKMREFRFGLLVGDPANPEFKHATILEPDYTMKEFYDWLRAGENIRTAQASREEYETRMRATVAEGLDILYIGCSSGLSGSVGLATIVAGEIMEENKDAKIVVIDALGGSLVHGALAYQAGLLKEEGMDIDELAKWVEANRDYGNQFVTVDTLKYLKKAGRVTGAAAFFGDMMRVKPIIISNFKGENYVLEKQKGKKSALNRCADLLIEAIPGNVAEHTVFVGHGDDIETAEMMIQLIVDRGVSRENIITCVIGPIVGTTSGPGMVGYWTLGKKKIC